MDKYTRGTVKSKFAHLYENVFFLKIKVVMDNHDEYCTLKTAYRAFCRNMELYQFIL